MHVAQLGATAAVEEVRQQALVVAPVRLRQAQLALAVHFHQNFSNRYCNTRCEYITVATP